MCSSSSRGKAAGQLRLLWPLLRPLLPRLETPAAAAESPAAPRQVDRRLVYIQNTALHVIDRGEGRPVVFLQGDDGDGDSDYA